MQLIDDAVGFGGIVLQNGNLNVVGIHLVADGAKQQTMRLGGAGKIVHTVFVYCEKFQRLLLFQQTD